MQSPLLSYGPAPVHNVLGRHGEALGEIVLEYQLEDDISVLKEILRDKLLTFLSQFVIDWSNKVVREVASDDLQSPPELLRVPLLALPGLGQLTVQREDLGFERLRAPRVWWIQSPPDDVVSELQNKLLTLFGEGCHTLSLEIFCF